MTYQLKLLATALFSVAMLRRRFSWVQWGALLALMAGVATVQLAFVQHDAGKGLQPLRMCARGHARSHAG